MALLEVTELTKRFGGLEANSGICLSVEQGRIFGIIGPNGSGKTTFFNCISGFYKPTSGKVVFDNHDITNLPPYRICDRAIARTFQIAEVITRMTVIENTMLGAFKKDKRVNVARDMAMETLGLVGLREKAFEPSKGLSPPERRRLSLAMAMVTNPKLLMLDEVMAGLLPTEISELLDLIRKINENGVTVMIIEHIMEVIMSLAQDIMVLESGKVIAKGIPKEISANERVIQAYLGEGYRNAQS